MSERDWKIALDVFRSCLPRRGERGHNDRLLLEALHYFAVHNVSWRATIRLQSLLDKNGGQRQQVEN
jgi:hypothetical protein